MAGFKRFARWLFVEHRINTFGALLLLIGVLSGIGGFRRLHVGAFHFADVIRVYYAAVSTELVSIAFTVLILNTMYQHRESRREKGQLVSLMGSSDSRITLEALENLRSRGWLKDGTLRGARLTGADLRGANMRMADLREADLQDAALDSTDLLGAKLSGANLQGAGLAGANLQRTRIDKAMLDGASLSHVNLFDSDVADEQLARAHMLVDAAMPNGDRYDGRFDLRGDVEQARVAGFVGSDPTAMARFYEVSLEAYERGRQTGAKVGAGAGEG